MRAAAAQWPRGAGVHRRTQFATRDLWRHQYGEYDDIIVFGVAEMMGELHAKLVSELKPDARLLVCRFPIPNHVPCHTVGSGIDSVWIYGRDAEYAEGYRPESAPPPPLQT